jgi:hypothetical protein
MHSTESLRSPTHRRPRIWRIVVLAVVIAAIGEPTIMYLALAREKEQRRAAAEITFGTPAARTVNAKAAVP